MDATQYTDNFTNMGKMIDLFNQVHAMRAAILVVEAEASAILDDDQDEMTALQDLLTRTKSLKSAMRSAKDGIVSAFAAYMKGKLRKDLNFCGSLDETDILDALALDMAANSKTVNENTVTATGIVYNTGNAGTGVLTISGETELLDNEALTFECVDATTEGAELWSVAGEEPDEDNPGFNGVLSTQLTTGVAVAVQNAQGQTLFTATIAVITDALEISGDADGECSAWSFTGGEKATNCDENGDVYCELDRLSAAESGDDNNQLSDWTNITGLSYRVNTDVDGKIYATIVDDGGGYFHVDLYKDTGRASGDKIAHTATYNAGGAQSLTADNDSGISGSITIDAATAADSDIAYVVGLDRVRVYMESGKTNLVADGGLVGGGATTLAERNSSGLSGSVTVAYNDGESAIRVRVPIAFAVGDKIVLSCTTDDDGTFQSFFRDEFGVVLPSDASPAISDSLAE